MSKKSKKKILIAEDDKFIAEMYVTKLTAEGFEAKSVENGQEAINELETFQPDIVLLDIMMPVMNGIEALKKIYKDMKVKVPVIVLTNANEKDYVSQALDLGARDYLVKSSHTPDEVVVKIKENL